MQNGILNIRLDVKDVEVEDWHTPTSFSLHCHLSGTYPLMSQWDTPETQQSTRGPRSGTQGIGRNLYSVTIRYPHMLVNIPVFIRISMVMVFKSQSNLFTIKTASSAGYSSMNLYSVCWKNSLLCHHCKCPETKKNWRTSEGSPVIVGGCLGRQMLIPEPHPSVRWAILLMGLLMGQMGSVYLKNTK